MLFPNDLWASLHVPSILSRAAHARQRINRGLRQQIDVIAKDANEEEDLERHNDNESNIN